MIGWALRQLVIFGGLALVLFAVTNRLLPQPTATPPAPAASAPEPAQARGAVPNALVFRANPQGHVVVEAAVNGVPVKFLVDTGATMVVLTLKDAAAAGISGSDLVFSMRTSTANGVARAAPVRLRELRIDQLMVRDVAAAVGVFLRDADPRDARVAGRDFAAEQPDAAGAAWSACGFPAGR